MCSCKNKTSNKQPAAVKQVVKNVPTPRSVSTPKESSTEKPATHVVRNIQRRRVVSRRPI